MVLRKIFVIVLISLLFPALSHAQETTPTPSPVEYTLPYPGLLPDNPLYFLRAIRDTMQSFLASNPLKKAEFYLLQADKGVSASSILVEKTETVKLAGATAIESQQYFEKAIEAVHEAKKQGLDTHEISKKLVTANAKHIELLQKLRGGLKDENKESFTKATEKAKELQKKAKALQPAK